jgi:hypothetical protein
MKQAFFEICREAKPAKASYVSLYVSMPFYGGPEEGGWWGRDVALVASQHYASEEAAEAAAEAVRGYAAKLSKGAKDQFHQSCAAECEWLEARGLDADFLPEVDGGADYFVAVEDSPGEGAYQSERGYS